MELVVGEGAFGLDIPRALINGQDSIRDDPIGGGAVGNLDPFVFVLTIEEDDSVGGRVTTFCARGYDRRYRRIDFRGTMIFDRVVRKLGPDDGRTCQQAEGGKQDRPAKRR